MLRCSYLNERSVLIEHKYIKEIQNQFPSLKRAESVTYSDEDGDINVSLYSKITLNISKDATVVSDKARLLEMQINYMRITDKGLELSQSVLNKTSEFILPLLGMTRASVQYDKLLLNAYVEYPDMLGLDDKQIVLLYRKLDSEYFRDKIDSKLQNVWFFNKIDDPFGDGNYVIYHKNVAKYEDEIRKILDGNYKMLSPLSKNSIRDFHVLEKNSMRYKQLYDYPEARKQMEAYLEYAIPSHMSLIDKPDVDEESLILEMFTECQTV